MSAYTHLLSIAAKRQDFALMAKLALTRNIEPSYAGNTKLGVFLGNAYADVRDLMTPVQWRQALSTLALRGEYEASTDSEFRGRFGYVIVQQDDTPGDFDPQQRCGRDY